MLKKNVLVGVSSVLLVLVLFVVLFRKLDELKKVKK